MEIIDRRLSLAEFRDYVNGYFFGTLPADKLVIHHTWRPTKASWAGERTIAGLKQYYEGKSWPAGPHLFVAEDGIWLFSPMRKDGIHAGTLNTRSIGIEVVGDYDTEKWSGQTLYNAVGAIKVLMDRLGIAQNNLFFHRDVSPKSCPGWAITKEWLFQQLTDFHFKPSIPQLPGLREVAEAISAPAPTIPSDSAVVMVPDWAVDAVNFVKQNNLFTVRNDEDVREAVKFHRLYKLIKNQPS